MSNATGRQWPEAFALAERMAGQGEESVRAILMYGSRLLKANPDGHSALDFVVIVEEYRAFYHALSNHDELGRPAGLMSVLARVLAPNVIAYVPDEGALGIAKCLVISRSDFERALGPTPADHFLLGRMVQRIGVVWTASDAEREWVQDVVSGAHARVIHWMAPYMSGSFDAPDLGRRLLEVCYQGELRPESRGRASRIFEAQSGHFAEALVPGLEAAVTAGTLRARQDGRYELCEPVAAVERRRWKRHFRRSKVRATMRWLKHTVTFANWLPYIVRKVERHTGRTIRLTTLERKLPILFLWPRAIHVLLTRPKREIKP